MTEHWNLKFSLFPFLYILWLQFKICWSKKKYVGLISLYTNTWKALDTIARYSFLLSHFEEGLQIPVCIHCNQQRWDTDTWMWGLPIFPQKHHH